jgi:hypothetical protein
LIEPGGFLGKFLIFFNDRTDGFYFSGNNQDFAPNKNKSNGKKKENNNPDYADDLLRFHDEIILLFLSCINTLQQH